MRINTLIVQEVIRGFRTSPPPCNASPANGPCCGHPTPFSRCAGRSGRPHGATACSRRSPPCRASCDRCCMATPPAVICPIRRGCGSRRRPPVKRVQNSRCVSSLSSWNASAAPCSESPWTTGVARPSHAFRRWLGMFYAGYSDPTGSVRPADGATAWLWLSRSTTAGAVPCGHRCAPDAGGQGSN